MAVAIGLGAYELATLGALAIGALFFASPTGQQATKKAVEGISEALDTPSEQTDAPPTTTTGCPPATQSKCKPCDPPPPPRIDRVPPSRPHWPCTGDHMHVFEMNQNPVTCQCFPKEKEVICL
jgi:hypothetical protein